MRRRRKPFAICLMTRLGPLLKSDKTTLVFEAIGDDKVRVTCGSWDDAILAAEGLEVVGMAKPCGVPGRAGPRVIERRG